MNFKPLFDRVVILPKTQNSVTDSGIVLPETSQERPQIGSVVAVGDGADFDGNKKEMKVKVGDEVLFNKYAGVELKLEGKTYIIMRQIDIIGVMK
ncbi:MAG: co-chaperone GroES [Clostridia bacterium]|nr:co-chaperone GroES [Clostridia bacterium]